MANEVDGDPLPSNPNFPLNLQISPSIPPAYSSYPTDKNLPEDENFGSLAQERAIRQYGIAGRVWEAAYMMNLYVHPPPQMEFDPPFIDASRASQRLTMIELGSGTGVVAFTLARLLKPGSDHLIATDLPEVCSLLESNLQSVKTQLERKSLRRDILIVKPLSWGSLEDALALASEIFEQGTSCSTSKTLTHIICSDLVYFSQLLGPLLRSLLHLSSPPFYSPAGNCPAYDPPTILISYKIRSLAKETRFWLAFGLWFEFWPVLARGKSPVGEWQRFGVKFDDPSFLFVAHRRPESYKWTIPELDEDLLGGVGASGTSSRKSDNTFENLLLMGLEE